MIYVYIYIYILHHPPLDLPDVNTTNSNLEFFDLASTLTLTSTFDGIPTPSVQWMHNGLAIDSSNDSVTITTSNTTSVLEWVDVTTDAVGNFLFVAANNLGLRNLSIAVMIRSKSGFVVLCGFVCLFVCLLCHHFMVAFVKRLSVLRRVSDFISSDWITWSIMCLLRLLLASFYLLEMQYLFAVSLLQELRFVNF